MGEVSGQGGMPTASASDARAVDAAGVGDESPCRRCGYSLRGLPLEGVCPECGAPVARSLRGDLLELASPAYLRRLGAGAAMVEAALVLVCIIPLGAVLLAFGLAVTPVAERYQGLAPVVGAGMCVLASVLILVGWLVLTAPDPARVGPDTADRTRLWTRVATILCSVQWLGAAALAASPGMRAAVGGSGWGGLLAAGSGLVIGAQVVLSLRYLTHLSRRIPDPRLAADARSSSRMAIVVGSLWVVVAVAGSFPVGLCLAVPGSIVAMVLMMILFVRYADVVDRARRHMGRLGASAEGVVVPAAGPDGAND